MPDRNELSPESDPAWLDLQTAAARFNVSVRTLERRFAGWTLGSWRYGPGRTVTVARAWLDANYPRRS